MDDTTRLALSRERIDILAGMVQSLRAELAAARADIARKDMALTTIADILKQRHQEGWEERLQAIARAALEVRT